MNRAVILLVVALASCTFANDADREGWQEDFEALVDHMAGVYANLEWATEERGLDVFTLYHDTRARLGAARSRRSARRAVRKFIAAFDDPHFRVSHGHQRQPGRNGTPDPGILPGTSADDALDAMGFAERNLDFRIAFAKLPGFDRVTPSDANPFAWATFAVKNRSVGVLRIAHFGDDGYPDVARALWPTFEAQLEGSCDRDCQWKFRSQVMDALLAFLAEGAAEFRRRGVAAVVIDITGNGGGTDWAAMAPRIFAPPLTRCPPIGVVRHPHHTERLIRWRDYLQSFLDERSLSDESRRTVEMARDSVAAMVRKTEEPCDRSGVFRTSGATLPCTQLAFSPACGVLEYLPHGSLPDLDERSAIFDPLDGTFEEGVWNGPLFVLMDHQTASASEHFISLLEANDAATFLGERTMGAGCGYIAGGIPAYLPHLDLTVRMPDCARFRANGRNEIEGFEPDIPVDWSGGTTRRARRVYDVLQGIL
jgi:hypothetical protein